MKKNEDGQFGTEQSTSGEELEVKINNQNQDRFQAEEKGGDDFSEEESGFWKRLNFMKKISLVGGAVALLVIAGIFYFYSFKKGVPLQVAVQKEQGGGESGGFVVAESQTVKDVKTNAFGKIVLGQNQQQNLSIATEGRGGGGLSTAAAPAIDKVEESRIMPYNPIEYVFKYAGEEFKVDFDKADVFKRIKDGKGISGFDKILKKFDFKVIDLASFDDVQLQSLHFVEDKELGMTVSLMIDEESISIGQNWKKWQNFYQECQTEECRKASQLKFSDIPSDEKLIEIADKFVSKHGISKEFFGQPVVDEQWKAYNVVTKEDEENQYVPEQISVIYPLMIEEQEVLDQSGNTSGMRVDINIRQQKVTSAYGINTQRYEKSSYEVENTTDKILKMAEKGGYAGGVFIEPMADNSSRKISKVELELDTPKMAYVTIWQWSNNENQELIVPAYIFPILNGEKENYYRKNVVVPIVKDLLENQ